MPTLEQLIAEALELTEGQERNYRADNKVVKVEFKPGTTQKHEMVSVFAYDHNSQTDWLITFSAWYTISTNKENPDADLVMIKGMLEAALVAVS
jgi:hypothetical protein